MNFTQILLPIKNNIINNNFLDNQVIVEGTKVNNTWEISIEKIGLSAPIREGVDSENLDKFIGHFEQSGYYFGNVALAAHNRGYPVNYFRDIKNLENGDKIHYCFSNLNLEYVVYSNRIIQDTDVYVIENTKENIITLITCVENRPNQRRCVQGKLKI